MRRRFKASKFFVFFFLALVGLTVFSTVVMLLWNALIPEIFHLTAITFYQALGLLILAKILFGGFRGGWGGCGGRWRHKMQQRWMNMTPEERERFKQEWGHRGGGRHGEFYGRGFEEGRSSGERQPREEDRSRGEV